MRGNNRTPLSANHVYGAFPRNLKRNNLIRLSIISFTILSVAVTAVSCGNAAQEPTAVEIGSDAVVFSTWQDVQDFFKQSAKNAQTLGPTADMGQQWLRQFEALKRTFKDKGKLLDIPAGTQIRVRTFCDMNGKEIRPVWKDNAQTWFTPTGDFVFVTGEWRRHPLITMLVHGITTSRVNAQEATPAPALVANNPPSNLRACLKTPFTDPEGRHD